ncbi:hypothetical protein ACFL6D_04095 [Spirochaetota bacterium]
MAAKDIWKESRKVFFTESKETPGPGFTDTVMKSLPNDMESTKKRIWRQMYLAAAVVVCTAILTIGIGLTIFTEKTTVDDILVSSFLKNDTAAHEQLDNIFEDNGYSTFIEE